MSFFVGLFDELSKLAMLPAVGKTSAKPPSQAGGMIQQSKPDPSPIASADRNTGVSTPAGQPEAIRGAPAMTNVKQTQPGLNKVQQFKAQV